MYRRDRLRDITTRKIHNPGKMETHHASLMNALPSLTIAPQAAVGGGMPAPRKLRIASVRISCPTRNVAMTITVLMQPVRMCQISILNVDAPTTLASAT